jgi:hypothetical protein
VEETSRQTRTLNSLEELFGNNGIGVDVRAIKWCSDALELCEFRKTGTVACRCAGAHCVALALFRKVKNVVEVDVRLRLVKLACG